MFGIQTSKEWAFAEAPRFSIVLTSTLLGELDDLKMPYRGESLSEKAEGAIRRIKEYQRRGDIHAGVTLRRERSSVRMTAREPDFTNTLSWLDTTVKDDRLLAAALEIVVDHPHSPVVIVTRDINMQNKARAAGLSFVEPPDPAEGTASPAPRRQRGPRADVQILSLKATGGSENCVDFSAEVVNYGAVQTRSQFTAHVGGLEAACQPGHLDLIPDQPPQRVRIIVSRPDVGDLVPEFGGETTLYGETLTFEATSGDAPVTRDWREVIYNVDDNRARHEIQQREWRIGRGEGTEADHRAEHFGRLAAKWSGEARDSE